MTTQMSTQISTNEIKFLHTELQRIERQIIEAPDPGVVDGEEILLHLVSLAAREHQIVTQIRRLEDELAHQARLHQAGDAIPPQRSAVLEG